jgi:stage II sporulation protein D
MVIYLFGMILSLLSIVASLEDRITTPLLPTNNDNQSYELGGGLSKNDVSIDVASNDSESNVSLPEGGENIRVVLKTDDYQELYHDAIEVVCEEPINVILHMSQGDIRMEYPAGEKLMFSKNVSFGDCKHLTLASKSGNSTISVVHLSRQSGVPAYQGTLDLFWEEKGLVLVNELPLEAYLCYVLPSEMPAAFPMEALKAQAICARTYAYDYLLDPAYPKWDANLDDSTTFQVYHNIERQPRTTRAVIETSGQILLSFDHSLAETYYYSTSCGVTSDASVWTLTEQDALSYLQAKEVSATPLVQIGPTLQTEEAFAAFIRESNDSHFESDEAWYRWTYDVPKIDRNLMLKKIQERYKVNPEFVLTYEKGEYLSTEPKKLSPICRILVVERGPGGIAEGLIIETTKEMYLIRSQYNIRYILYQSRYMVTRNDGRQVSSPSILPSAFFVLETNVDDNHGFRYTILGGGFGHGVGMSQNGAKSMADAGYTAERILEYFYEGCYIKLLE